MFFGGVAMPNFPKPFFFNQDRISCIFSSSVLHARCRSKVTPRKQHLIFPSLWFLEEWLRFSSSRRFLWVPGNLPDFSWWQFLVHVLPLSCCWKCQVAPKPMDFSKGVLENAPWGFFPAPVCLCRLTLLLNMKIRALLNSLNQQLQILVSTEPVKRKTKYFFNQL